MNQKPDYGVDSPNIIAGLLVFGALALGGAMWRPHLLHLPMRWVGIVAGIYFLQGALSMLFYSKVGKLRMREQFLNSIPWRGDEHVLDIGCGRGLLTVAAAKRVTTGRVTGVDVWLPLAMSGNRANSVLENAAREGVSERVEVKEADARELPFPDSSFDIVVSNFVLHEMSAAPDREKMIQEIARVLKPSGHVGLRDFVFTDTCVDALRKGGVSATRKRVGGFGFWVGAILNFGLFRLYHVTGRKEPSLSGAMLA